jgi:class 3 adenylate cyclase
MGTGKTLRGLLMPVPGDAAWAAGAGGSRSAGWPLGPERTTIGRATDCDVVIRDPSVSRRHASLGWQDGRLLVTHLSATNPTLVNGVPVPHGEPLELSASDTLQVGTASLEVLLWGGEGDDLTRPHAPPRSLVVILAADVVGYTVLCKRDETGTIARFLQCLKAFRRQAQAHRGRVLDTGEKGDCVYSLYHSIVLAMGAAVAIRAEVATVNQGVPADRRIDFRFGMHSGDVVFEGQGVRGDAINTAAHLQAEAAPGEIVVSERVQQELAAHGGFSFEAFRPRHAKNAGEARAYRLTGAG